ncbi:MAG TPA: hypothetical protein VE685_17660 [Thermoanaerobaculia bacterium]|nr:hypothetical protein [Thermoanaerobaculia bacterium]
MDLPQPLAPWGPYLSLFPRDLALSLGPVLQRLSLAVGPLRVRRPSGEGDPDGFDGLDRHGPYERLLPSEWLLAEEAPEEFLRRAAAGEHTFLRTSRPEPGGTRISVALFDAGPGQLGSPRIAQLAALIVLARRAEAAGARFGWAVLQEPASPLLTEVTPAAVLRLLASRTSFEATDSQIEAWSTRLSGWKELDDAWIVGVHHPGVPPLDCSASLLQIWDALDPRVRRVKVAVRRAGLPAGEVALDLPDDATCARLLRDPFGAEASVPRRVAPGAAPASNLVFSGNGTKIFARGREGEVLAIPVPNSPRAVPGRVRRYDIGQRAPAVAAGLAGRAVAVVTTRDGGVVLHLTHKRDDSAFYQISFPEDPARAAGFQPVPGDCLRPLLQVRSRLLVLDGEGGLFRFQDAGGERWLLRLAPRTVAAVSFPAHVAWVEPASPGRSARICISGGGSPSEVRDLEGTSADEAFFGCGGGLAHPQYGLVAVRRDEWTWTIFFREGARDLTPFSRSRVVGVGRIPGREDPALLLLDEDRRTLVLTGLRGTRTLPPASSPIEHVAASHTAPTIAYSTVDGEVVIYSLKRNAVVARLVPEGEG